MGLSHSVVHAVPLHASLDCKSYLADQVITKSDLAEETLSLCTNCHQETPEAAMRST